MLTGTEAIMENCGVLWYDDTNGKGGRNVYRIAICDDCRQDAEYLQQQLSQWAENRLIEIHTDCFSSSEQFLFHYAEEKRYDCLLLDIEMGVMDGVTLAKHIRRDNETLPIVFITGYDDYLAEGYEVAALHYLIKPVKKDKLFGVLDRAVERRKRDERCLNLELSGEMVRIPFYEIRYMDVHHNYVTIHGKLDHTVKRTLSDLEAELDERFCRVGRAMILNIKYIQRVTKTQVFLSDGTVLPLPRGAYEPLNRAIIEHA